MSGKSRPQQRQMIVLSERRIRKEIGKGCLRRGTVRGRVGGRGHCDGEG